MVTKQNSEVIPNKFNMDRICTEVIRSSKETITEWMLLQTLLLQLQ
jgi:hypothetical protein